MLSLTLFRLSLRQLLSRHRLFWLTVLALIALIPALIGGISVAANHPIDSSQLFTEIGLPLVLPLIALIVYATLLREEIRNQTIIYLVTKPIARAMIVLSKFAAGLLLIWVLVWLSLLISAAVIGDPASVLGSLLAAAALIALTYGAFFLAVSLVFKRALLWGLAYLIVWEGILANLAPGISQLSIHHYAAQFTDGLPGTAPGGDWSSNLWILLVITIISLVLAAWQLGRMEFPGESD